MASLILELQADCLDSKVPVSFLLRKALVVSKKLAVPDIEVWIEHELNGYVDEVPAYRRVKGQVKARNPFQGWIPVVFGDEQEAELLSYQNMGQPIAELEDLTKGGESQTLSIYYGNYIQNALSVANDTDCRFALQVTTSKVKAAIDAVRTRVLEWALRLEKQGIVGEGMTFSKEEKAAAAAVSYVTNNIIGEMHHSQLQQHAQHSSQTLSAGFDVDALQALVKDLQEAATKLNLSPEQAQELAAELATLHSQSGSPKPKAGIIRESLASVRTIFEGAAGNMAASTVGERAIQFLQSLG